VAGRDKLVSGSLKTNIPCFTTRTLALREWKLHNETSRLYRDIQVFHSHNHIDAGYFHHYPEILTRVKGSNMTHTILRFPAVQATIGLSRSTIYLRIAEGTFPRPVSLGARAVGWLQSDIEEWLRQRIELNRTQS
jgi:prophage regulatory protein